MRARPMTTALAAAALAVTGTLANAATVNIDTVTGLWTSVIPGNTVGLTGVGTSVIEWGTPVDETKSGYTFTPIAPQTDVSSPFDIGIFTHNNFPIFALPDPSSILGATLQVTVNGNVDNGGPEPFELISEFVFSHDETPNLDDVEECDPAKQASDTPCDDVVTLVSSTSIGDSIIIDGEEVILTISGFRIGDDMFMDFLTEENLANDAFLMAEFQVDHQVPTPAPLLLIAAGIFGLFGASRVRRLR